MNEVCGVFHDFGSNLHFASLLVIFIIIIHQSFSPQLRCKSANDEEKKRSKNGRKWEGEREKYEKEESPTDLKKFFEFNCKREIKLN